LLYDVLFALKMNEAGWYWCSVSGGLHDCGGCFDASVPGHGIVKGGRVLRSAEVDEAAFLLVRRKLLKLFPSAIVALLPGHGVGTTWDPNLLITVAE
jgi:hypothetical protein